MVHGLLKKSIEERFHIPNYFKTEITILNRYDNPKKIDRNLKKKFKGTIWKVGLTRVDSKRAMAYQVTPTSRNMYTGLKAGTMAHEFGHAIGFIDEYFPKKKHKCQRDHIMCTSSSEDTIFNRGDITYFWNLIRNYPFGEKIKKAKRFNRARAEVREREKDMTIIDIKTCKSYGDAISEILEGGVDVNSQSRAFCQRAYSDRCILNSKKSTEVTCKAFEAYSSKTFSNCPYCSGWNSKNKMKEYPIEDILGDNESINSRPISHGSGANGEVVNDGPTNNSTPFDNRPIQDEAEYEYPDLHDSNTNLFQIQSNQIRRHLLSND